MRESTQPSTEATAHDPAEFAGSPLPHFGDPALVELLISTAPGDPERARAARLLGLTPSTLIRVLAVEGDPDELTVEYAGWIARAQVGRLTAVLVREFERKAGGLSSDTRLGVGPLVRADEAWQSWKGARLAIRFAPDRNPERHDSARPNAIFWDDLGGVAMLAEYVPIEAISRVRDVVVLDRLASERNGATTIRVLRMVCQTESARQAAVALHMHHSSVLARIERAAASLGFPLTTPLGRSRLSIALALRHLRDSNETGL